MKPFLRTHKDKIIGPKGKPVHLHGVNVGGWLMMEAYILHAANTPEQRFKKNFKQALGQKALDAFEKSFRDNFIREGDFKDFAGYGFNCVRVPFNYRLIGESMKKINPVGLAYLDKVVAWARKYRIWVILDLHATFGCQNHDWHSDSYGKAELWTNKANWHKTYELWEFLADRYKACEQVAGYDLLNESVVGDMGKLNVFYQGLIKAIRGVDRNHILFIEGNRWAIDVEGLDEFTDDNHVISIHNYEPLRFTFNFVPHLRYPAKGLGNAAAIKKHLAQYAKFSRQRQVPIYVGEFGVNYREGIYGETKWLEDNLRAFKEFGFHWTYWTYKAVKNNAFPDGVLSYYDNPAWVNRAGPLMGWDTYHNCWEKNKADMVRSWQSGQFKANSGVLDLLKKYA